MTHTFKPGDSVTVHVSYVAEFVRYEPAAPGIAMVTVTEPLLSWHEEGEWLHVDVNILYPKADEAAMNILRDV